MADRIPRHPFTFLDTTTRTGLWVEWQRRRRHPEYSPAVDVCLREMAAHLPTLPLTHSLEDQERGQTLQDIMTLNDFLRQQPASTTEEMDSYTTSWLALALKRLSQAELRAPAHITVDTCGKKFFPTPSHNK